MDYSVKGYVSLSIPSFASPLISEFQVRVEVYVYGIHAARSLSKISLLFLI